MTGAADCPPLSTALLQPWNQSRGRLAFLLEGILDTRGPGLGKAPVSCWARRTLWMTAVITCKRTEGEEAITTKGGSISMELGEADPFRGREKTELNRCELAQVWEEAPSLPCTVGA